MSSDDRGLLDDMLKSARMAVAYVSGITFEEFSTDTGKQDSVVYRVGIIGEAARHVSEDAKRQIALDWPAMMGMRNRLFHGYRDVRVSVVWTTVSRDLPHVIATLEAFLEP